MYNRRVLPYRTRNRGVEGVVITFTDITERKRVKRALEQAKQQAERAKRANPDSSPLPVTIFVSRFKPCICFKVCWQKSSKERKRKH